MLNRLEKIIFLISDVLYLKILCYDYWPCGACRKPCWEKRGGKKNPKIQRKKGKTGGGLRKLGGLDQTADRGKTRRTRAWPEPAHPPKISARGFPGPLARSSSDGCVGDRAPGRVPAALQEPGLSWVWQPQQSPQAPSHQGSRSNSTGLNSCGCRLLN